MDILALLVFIAVRVVFIPFALWGVILVVEEIRV